MVKKIKWLKNWYQDRLADPSNGETVFLVGYAMYLATAVWATTMFPMSKMVQALCMLISLLCIAVKILLYGEYSMNSLLLLVGAGVMSAIGLYKNHYVYPLIWLVLIAGSYRVPLEKILKIYLLVV